MNIKPLNIPFIKKATDGQGILCFKLSFICQDLVMKREALHFSKLLSTQNSAISCINTVGLHPISIPTADHKECNNE
jgi:hypothetical protein